MRADAQRNADKLRAAAAEVFSEEGLGASLKEIARRAGVSHGTLYNLFGSREALIDAVVVDLAAAPLEDAGARALAFGDPWGGFVFYITEVCTLQSTNCALGDVVVQRIPGVDRLLAVCDRTRSTADKIVDRAHRSGRLREDFTTGDLLLLFGTTALLTRAAGDTAGVVWRRALAFTLDGLRTEAARPLPYEVPTPQGIMNIATSLASTI